MSKKRNRNRDAQPRQRDESSASSTSSSSPDSETRDESNGAAEGAAEGSAEGTDVAAAGPAAARAEGASTSSPRSSEPAFVIDFPARTSPPRPIPTGPLYDALAPLVDRLRAGRCVLWAGAGLEEAAGGVGFRGLVARLLSELPPGAEVDEARELLPRRPFLVAGFVKRRLGDRFPEALRAATATTGELLPEIAMLGELPFRAVLTTGFSDLLARAFTRDGQPLPSYTARGVARREGRGPYLLKALGEPGSDEGVVFSASDFQRLLGEEGLAATVRDFYRNRTILFIGVDAPVDVDRLFVRLLQGTPLEGVEHYAVLPGLSRLEREELESSYKLRILDEADVLAVIRALRESVGDVTESLPDDDDLEGWIGLLTAEPDRQEALDKIAALERKLAGANEHERLLELHLGMVEIESTPKARAHRLSLVAGLFERAFADPGKAFTALLAGYKEAPEHASHEDLERLAATTGSWAELLGEYVQAAPGLPPEQRAAHWLRAARLYADKIGQADYALHALDEAQKAGPETKEALELRVAVLRRAEKWRELVDALGKLAEREESLGRRSELLLEQGDVLESRLLDGEAAIKAYRAALEADAGSSDALSALEHLLRRRGELRELVAVLDEKAKYAVDKARALEHRLEAASIAAEKLDDRRDAITRYELIALDEPSVAVLRALEKLYEAEGRTEDYLRAVADQVELVKDAGEKATLLRRLGAEWEQRPGAEGVERATFFYEKLVAVEPRSEDGFRALERLYRAAEKWAPLVETLKRHQEVPGVETEARARLQVQLADVLETRLHETERALEAWQAVRQIAPSSDEAMAALTRIYEANAQWDKALAHLDQRIGLARDKTHKAELLHESGKLAAERLSDVKGAEERYHRALELDHAFVPAMLAMVELYRKSGEFLRAAKLLVEAAEHTTNRLEKTRMLVEAGEVYDSLDQHGTATELLLKALSVDPEHVEAGARVAELLWKAERYAELVPVLEMLTRKEADRQTTKQRYLRLGRAARALSLGEKAARAYTKAAELDPTDVEAQRASGEIFFAEGKWPEAREAWKAVLGHGGDDIPDAERVELYYRIGECDRKLGQLDKAKNFYAKALEIDATHRPTILARLELESDDPTKLVEAKRALLATASDDEKVKLLTEIGDTLLDKLSDRAGAIAAWREAIVVRPESRNLLHKCLDVYVEDKDWPSALGALERLTDLEKVPAIRAKLKYTRAIVALDELSDRESAIKLLSEAVDDDPSAARVGEKLEELLAQAESWKELQRYYRKVIKRMAPEAESDSAETKKERLRIWNALADVSIDKLGEIGVGLPALEVVATLDAQSAARKEKLADLYVEAGPDYLEKGIAAHQALLRLQRDRIASYRALRKLYGDTKQPEKALAVAYALSFLKKGAPEDEAIVAEAKKRPMQPARRNLDDDLWTKSLLHHEEDRLVSSLFGALVQTLMLANSVPHKEVPLAKKDKVEDTDPRGFAKGIRYVANALNVRLPYEVYVKYEQREPLSIANVQVDAKPSPTAAACLVVGQPLLGDKRSERELVYELTKRLAYFRSDRYLRFVIPQPSQLGMLIDAAMVLGGDAPGGTDAGLSKVASDWKRALPPKSIEQIAAIGKKLKATLPGRGEAAATAWLAATELTATRAAYLLVGDLETTARFVVAEPAAVSPHPAISRLKELIHFSITEECFALRKHVGLMP